MKRLLAILLMAAMLLSLIPMSMFPVFAASASEIGDIDTDGDVDASDYILVKRAVLKTYTLSDAQKTVADVDGDNDIDATDYVLVKRIVLHTYCVQHNYKDGSCTVCKASEPNYYYAGTKIKTITNVTGAVCTGSYTKLLDLYPVAKEYVTGCESYSYAYYASNQFEKYQTEEYKKYFLPYIEYLDSLGLECTKRPVISFGGFMEEDYQYKVDEYTINVSWGIYEYSNGSYISIDILDWL